MSTGDAVANLDRLRGAKGEILIRQTLRDQRLQEITRLWTHHRHHGFGHGDIHGKAMRPVRNMTVDPVKVAAHCRRRRNHQKFIRRQPGDGYISLDMPAFIQELGVDDLAIRHRDIIATQPLQHRFGILADHPDLAEAGQIEHADIIADGLMFIGAVTEPVLALPAIFIFRLLAGIALGLRQEPVGTLPSADLAKAGALALQPVMDR